MGYHNNMYFSPPLVHIYEYLEYCKPPLSVFQLNVYLKVDVLVQQSIRNCQCYRILGSLSLSSHCPYTRLFPSPGATLPPKNSTAFQACSIHFTEKTSSFFFFCFLICGVFWGEKIKTIDHTNLERSNLCDTSPESLADANVSRQKKMKRLEAKKLNPCTFVSAKIQCHVILGLLKGGTLLQLLIQLKNIPTSSRLCSI